MIKSYFLIGSILCGIAVGMGAFGAHGLQRIVHPEKLDTWEKAVHYQMFHALAFFALAWAISYWPKRARLLNVGGWFFLAGAGLFSGSLYLLVLSGEKWLGAITPIGGVAFIAGWVCLILAAWKA